MLSREEQEKTMNPSDNLTDPFTALELQIQSQILQSTIFEALKLWNGWSGSSSFDHDNFPDVLNISLNFSEIH